MPESLLVCAPLGDVQLVVDAGRVERIADAIEAAERSQFDLSAVLGLESAGDRRALVLHHARHLSMWALVGAHVHIQRVDDSAFVAWPAWLAGTSIGLPLSRVVRLETGFGFELDVDGLFASQASGERGG